MAAIDEFDPDLVAAFIDGRLSGAERDRVVRLLAESEAAFEIYADAVRARDDLDADTVVPFPEPRPDPRPDARPDPRPDPRPRHWWRTAGVPLAAAAALLIAVLPAVQSRRANATFAMRAESIAQPLTGRPQLAMALRSALDAPRWSVTRGGGSTFVDSTAALRLGVRATDLQVALAVGDRERAGRAAAEMVELLGSVNLSDAASAEYGDLRKRIANGDSIGQVIGAAATADDNLRHFLDSRWYGVGKWLAAGELAARAHSADFFKSSETARFLDAAIRSGSFAPDEVEALRQVEGVAKRGMSENEFETVRARFAELIQRHAG
jgi:hypothetical protein